MGRGLMQYAVQQCDKNLTQSSHLMRHIKSQSGEHPLVCQQCGSSLYQSDGLNTHMTHAFQQCDKNL